MQVVVHIAASHCLGARGVFCEPRAPVCGGALYGHAG